MSRAGKEIDRVGIADGISEACQLRRVSRERGGIA